MVNLKIKLQRRNKPLYKSRKRSKPLKGEDFYKLLWKEVDGQLISTFDCHPDYFNLNNRKFIDIRISICKRIVGRLNSALKGKSFIGS